MIVWFGNKYGWLWILLSGGCDYTRGYDLKKFNDSYVLYYCLSYILV